MYLAVKVVGYYAVELSSPMLLMTQIVTGVVVYLLGAWMFRFEALKEFVKTVKGVFKR